MRGLPRLGHLGLGFALHARGAERLQGTMQPIRVLGRDAHCLLGTFDLGSCRGPRSSRPSYARARSLNVLTYAFAVIASGSKYSVELREARFAVGAPSLLDGHVRLEPPRAAFRARQSCLGLDDACLGAIAFARQRHAFGLGGGLSRLQLVDALPERRVPRILEDRLDGELVSRDVTCQALGLMFEAFDLGGCVGLLLGQAGGALASDGQAAFGGARLFAEALDAGTQYRQVVLELDQRMVDSCKGLLRSTARGLGRVGGTCGHGELGLSRTTLFANAGQPGTEPTHEQAV
jgi:hypothetical protein